MKQQSSNLKWVVIGLVVVLLAGGSMVSTYNKLVSLDQGVQAQWAQVENVYQRRADLIPNLVQTVKGAAAFEKETFLAVTEARARVGQVSPEALKNAASNPESLQQFQQAQDQLTGALSKLMVVVEKYPDLKATANFRDLQVQLEGTENRISVERMRFNESAQAFNTQRASFPTSVFAGFFGAKFQEKAYFTAAVGANVAPTVAF